MKKCNTCGNRINDDSIYCSSCGSNNLVFEPNSGPYYNYPPYGYQNMNIVEDKGSFWWAVLGFFVPVAGVVLYAIWSSNRPNDAKKALYGAIAYFILCAALFAIFFIFWLATFFMYLG